jgi:hypothetical protein
MLIFQSKWLSPSSGFKHNESLKSFKTTLFQQMGINPNSIGHSYSGDTDRYMASLLQNLKINYHVHNSLSPELTPSHPIS